MSKKLITVLGIMLAAERKNIKLDAVMMREFGCVTTAKTRIDAHCHYGTDQKNWSVY